MTNFIQNKYFPYVLAIMCGFFIFILSQVFSPVFDDLENRFLDYRFQLRGGITQDHRIVLVDIDDTSIRKYGRWPWDREIHAEMIELLNKAKARIIAFDIIFNEKGSDAGDKKLIETSKKSGNVFYPIGIELLEDKNNFISGGKIISPIPELIAAGKGMGHISANRDHDGSIRRVPLIIKRENELFFAFGFRIMMDYLKIPFDQMVIDPGKNIMLKEFKIPIDFQRMMRINYAGGWENTFTHYSFGKLLENYRQKKEVPDFDEKIILIINASTGTDLKTMPFQKDFPGGGIHANIINTILTKNFLCQISRPVNFFIIILLSLITAAFMIRVGARRAVPLQIVFILSVIIIYLAANFFAFKYFNLILEMISPLLTVVFTSLIISLYLGKKGEVSFFYMQLEKEKAEMDLEKISHSLSQNETELLSMQKSLGDLHLQVKENNLVVGEQIKELEQRLQKELNEKKQLLMKRVELEAKVNDLSVVDFKRAGAENTDAMEKECLLLGIVTKDEKMFSVFRKAKKVAINKSAVLIIGKPGTGKELFARALHTLSPRQGMPFITVNVPAIADSLLESELFGIEKGVATGVEKRKGKFQLAHQGTIFLDEIGEMRIDLQAKLLRVLQFGEIDMVGNHSMEKVDVRIIAATNRDLVQEIKKGNFREDLFYRLNVITLNIPALKERKQDFELLVNHFIHKYNQEFNKKIEGISGKALEKLKSYPWEGNVRELENTLVQSITMTEGEIIGEKDLDLGENKLLTENGNDEEFLDLLRRNNFEINAVADRLKVSRGTVSARFKGICFQYLALYKGNIDAAARKLTEGEKNLNIIVERMEEYYNNLQSLVKDFKTADEAVGECSRRFKNIPQKYLPFWEELIRNKFLV